MLTKRLINAVYNPSTSSLISLTGQNAPALNSLKAWFKADGQVINGSSVTPADGDTVATWGDASGNGFDLVQGTDGNRPTYILNQINGYPVIRFDGVDNHLASSANFSITGDSVFSLFMVLKVTETAGTVHLGGWGANAVNAIISFELTQDATDQIALQIGGSAANSTSTFTYAAFKALTMTKAAGVINTNTLHYTNGTVETTAGAAGTANTGSGPLRLGVDATLSGYASQDVAEVIIYDTVLSTADRDAVHAYLAAKYNLTIA